VEQVLSQPRHVSRFCAVDGRLDFWIIGSQPRRFGVAPPAHHAQEGVAGNGVSMVGNNFDLAILLPVRRVVLSVLLGAAANATIDHDQAG
jgi:hypothetical protein